MPVSLEFLDEGRGAMYTAHGHMKGAEGVDAIRTVNASHLAGSPVLYTFFDFNGITGLDISTADIQEAADIAVEASKKKDVGRVVAVHAIGDLTYGLMRMWEVFVSATGWETMVFRERSEAVAWVKKRVAEKFGVDAKLE